MKSKFWKILLSFLVIVAIATTWFFWEPTHFVSTSKSGFKINGTRGKIAVPEVRGKSSSRNIKVKYIKLKAFQRHQKHPYFIWQADQEMTCAIKQMR